MSEDSKGPGVPEGWPPRGGNRGGGGGGNSPIRIELPKIETRYVVIALIVILLGVGVYVMSRSLREVKASQVAVIVNYLSGEKSLRNEPGYVVVFPFVQEIFIFEKTPIQFIMEGDRDVDHNHVRKLTVRAIDGSNFWFDKLEIQYRIIPEKAASTVISDSGTGEAYKVNWVKTYARSILRDEFGRYNAETVADPSQYGKATREARRRLNDALDPHGITIREIIAPKPKFDVEYERLIENRKVANQEVERLKAQAEQLKRERERRVAEIGRSKATEFERLKGDFEAERIAATRAQVKKEKDADAYKITALNQGAAVEQQMLQEARGLEEQARAEAEGLRARVDALAQRGAILVREAWAAKLAGIVFEVIPYRRDPAPIRIEHMGGVVTPAGGKENN